jgi:hypothetical protein
MGIIPAGQQALGSPFLRFYTFAVAALSGYKEQGPLIQLSFSDIGLRSNWPHYHCPQPFLVLLQPTVKVQCLESKLAVRRDSLKKMRKAWSSSSCSMTFSYNPPCLKAKVESVIRVGQVKASDVRQVVQVSGSPYRRERWYGLLLPEDDLSFPTKHSLH